MAHSCPECRQVCTCGGDIDDLVFENTRHEQLCIHWEQCNSDYPDDWFEETDDAE